MRYNFSKSKREQLKQGKTQIDRLLDIETFLRNQMFFEIFLKIKATKLERYLIKNNHNFVLDTTTGTLLHSDTSSLSKSDPDEIISA